MQNKINNDMNFVFWGTPNVASETLEIMKQAGYLPSLVITSPDKPQGRKMLLTPPPVKVWAEENKIQYVQPEKKEEFLSIFSRYVRPSRKSLLPLSKKSKENPPYDLFIVVAYGKILPEEIIKMPKLGSINIHYSLLPKYRGASPVESAILNGDTETGVTIQQMEYKLDAGGILAQEKVSILPDEEAPDLRKRLIKIGGELLVKTLPRLTTIKSIPQNENKATHCSKIKKEDGLIDLNGDSIKNYNKFRAYATWPRTFFFKDGKRIIITNAELVDGKFTIKKIIPESGKEMDYKN